MDFSLRRINGVNMHYFDSREESDIQLVFCPGGLNPELWKHQLRYFSRKCRAISFQPTKSFRGFDGEKEALEAVLDQDEIDNAVLVSNITGNSLVQEFEERDDVKATVLTEVLERRLNMPETLYRGIKKTLSKSPKILKKLFFSGTSDYRVVKKFSRDFDLPGIDVLSSFTEKELARPVKTSLVIHGEGDRFSSAERARDLDARLSTIKRAGTFSFYEKPQEYNKALNDFLEIVKDSMEEEQVIESHSKNHSLLEFEKKRNKVKLKR